jgi:hypothetical protein
MAEKFGQINVYHAFCQNVGDRSSLSKSSVRRLQRAGRRQPHWRAPLLPRLHRRRAHLRGVQGRHRGMEPLVRPRGILCGHDYGLKFPGVPRAVDEAGGKPIPKAQPCGHWRFSSEGESPLATFVYRDQKNPELRKWLTKAVMQLQASERQRAHRERCTTTRPFR